VTPLATSDVDLPPCERSALAIVRDYMARRDPRGRSFAGLNAPVFPEAKAGSGG